MLYKWDFLIDALGDIFRSPHQVKIFFLERAVFHIHRYFKYQTFICQNVLKTFLTMQNFHKTIPTVKDIKIFFQGDHVGFLLIDI